MLRVTPTRVGKTNCHGIDCPGGSGKPQPCWENTKHSCCRNLTFLLLTGALLDPERYFFGSGERSDTLNVYRSGAGLYIVLIRTGQNSVVLALSQRLLLICQSQARVLSCNRVSSAQNGFYGV